MTDEQAEAQGYFKDGEFYRNTETDKHGVVCKCGCFKFELSYGMYELIAECSDCGRKEVVYSG